MPAAASSFVIRRSCFWREPGAIEAGRLARVVLTAQRPLVVGTRPLSRCRTASRRHLTPRRRRSAAASSAACRHASKTVLAARSPCICTRSRNAGPGSGSSRPALRPALPARYATASMTSGRCPPTAQGIRRRAAGQTAADDDDVGCSCPRRRGKVGSTRIGNRIDPGRHAVASLHAAMNAIRKCREHGKVPSACRVDAMPDTQCQSRSVRWCADRCSANDPILTWNPNQPAHREVVASARAASWSQRGPSRTAAAGSGFIAAVAFCSPLQAACGCDGQLQASLPHSTDRTALRPVGAGDGHARRAGHPDDPGHVARGRGPRHRLPARAGPLLPDGPRAAAGGRRAGRAGRPARAAARSRDAHPSLPRRGPAAPLRC